MPVQRDRSLPSHQDSVEDQLEPDTPVQPTKQSRLWSSFLLVALVFLAAILLQILLALFLVFTQLDSLENIAVDLQALMLHPLGFIAFAACGQLAILSGTITAVTLSPEKSVDRIKWRSPDWTPARYGLFVMGTLVPAAIGVFAAWCVSLLISPDDSIETLYDNMTWAWAIPFIVFISLSPGIIEEMLFRGYVQGRLLKRVTPTIAILISSLLFALFHITPHAIAFTFPLGIWLGVLAWKTNSIWPSVVCHAGLNAVWNAYQITTHMVQTSGELETLILVALGMVGLVAFLVCITILNRTPTPPSTDEA